MPIVVSLGERLLGVSPSQKDSVTKPMGCEGRATLGIVLGTEVFASSFRSPLAFGGWPFCFLEVSLRSLPAEAGDPCPGFQNMASRSFGSARNAAFRRQGLRESGPPRKNAMFRREPALRGWEPSDGWCGLRVSAPSHSLRFLAAIQNARSTRSPKVFFRRWPVSGSFASRCRAGVLLVR